MVPTPTKVSRRSFINDTCRAEVAQYHLTEEFKDYFDQIIYLDDHDFLDAAHLKDPQKYTDFFKDKFGYHEGKN